MGALGFSAGSLRVANRKGGWDLSWILSGMARSPAQLASPLARPLWTNVLAKGATSPSWPSIPWCRPLGCVVSQDLGGEVTTVTRPPLADPYRTQDSTQYTRLFYLVDDDIGGAHRMSLRKYLVVGSVPSVDWFN